MRGYLWPAISVVIWGSELAARELPRPSFDEIVVRGERSDRLLIDTASSVQVMDQDWLDSQPGDDRLEQLLAGIPNVQLGSGTEGPTIRGQDSTGVLRDLPAFLGGTRPRVTLQVDGRAVSFNEFVFGAAPVWDVARIEVFRSPQTTTQGRNAIGGAIFIETMDPQYSWLGRARLIGASRDTWQTSAALTGPLAAEQLAFRISADWRRSRPASKIVDRIRGADPDHDEYGMVRFRLLAEPQALEGVRLETTYVHIETEMPQIEGVLAPFKERRDPTPGYGFFATNVDSLTGVVTYDATPDVSVRSTISGGRANVRRFAPPAFGETQTRSRDFSLETVVEWKPDGPASLLAGVHHDHSSAQQVIDLSAVIGLGSFRDRQSSLGLFSEATLRPGSRWSITGGIRYQRDSQHRRGALVGPRVTLGADFNRQFERWLPKLSVIYSLSENARVGIVAKRAYNPGGTALNLETGQQNEFGAESLWNYETFLRTSDIAPGLSVSLNLFLNDMHNSQRARLRSYTIPGGLAANWAEIVNVPRAVSYGGEAQINWRASERLTLELNAGLLRTRIRHAPTPADPLQDKQFQRSPKLSMSTALQWVPVDHLQLSVQLRHNSGYFSDDENAPVLRVDGTTVVDGKASYSAGRWQIFAYARNMLDRFYMMQLSSSTRGTAGAPRDVGVGFKLDF